MCVRYYIWAKLLDTSVIDYLFLMVVLISKAASDRDGIQIRANDYFMDTWFASRIEL